MPEIFLLPLEDQFVVFILDRNDFTLPAGIVERIVRSIYITGVPGTQENILSVICERKK